MKIIDCKQNSEQWEAIRRLMPTASEMHRVVCPSMGSKYVCNSCDTEYERKRKHCTFPGCEGEILAKSIVKESTAQTDYIYRMIAESMENRSLAPPPSRWMENGHEQEANAVREYEFMTGRETQEVGFCTTDDGLVGCSPDRLVGKDGLLEAKCPSPWVHLRHMHMLDLESDHKVQVQGQMLVTGRQWVDVISFNPGYPSVIIRAERDEEYIQGVNEILVKFVERLHRTRAELLAKYGDFGHKAQGGETPMPDDAFDAFCRSVV